MGQIKDKRELESDQKKKTLRQTEKGTMMNI